jgi:hypothetical protein
VSGQTVVFTGPSLDPQLAGSLLPDAAIRPPIRRGELRAARIDGMRIAVIIDGLFAHTLAVSPREVVQVLRSGAVVIGAASLGAIRAAECAPVGMIGVGQIYSGYRARRLSDDDEVAVVTDPDDGYRAVTVSLVTIRAALTRLAGGGELSRRQADRVLAAASRVHFSERTWTAIVRAAGVNSAMVDRLAACPDPKREDAVASLYYVDHHRDELLSRTTPAPPGLTFPRDERYPGHDPLLGSTRAELEPALIKWMAGSGRMRRFLVPGKRTAEMWSELERSGELEAELMLHYAIQTCADRPPSRDDLLWARERVAVAHGYRDWSALEQDLWDGAHPAAVPVPWVEQAVSRLAAARP